MKGRRLAVLWASVLVVLATLPAPSHAATLVVDSSADDMDRGSTGNCTLREAIQAANTNGAVDACPAGSTGLDSIQLSAGYYGLRIPGADEDANATGDLDVTSDIEIDGAGATATIIEANHVDRVLHVLGGTVVVRGVRVRAGKASYEGGGILNEGELTLIRCRVDGNQAGTGQLATSGYGGGIQNRGDLSLTETSVTDNTTRAGAAIPCIPCGSGFCCYGPGLAAGAGISNSRNLTMEASLVATNHAVPQEPLAPPAGAGLFNVGTAWIRNSTIANNDGASLVSGTEIFSLSTRDTPGVISLEHATIVGVASEAGRTVITTVGEEGLPVSSFSNSVIAGQCATQGIVVSLGGNAESPGASCRLSDQSDQPYLSSARLGALTHRGGATWTMAALAGSSLIDRASAARCIGTDQRGLPRPADGDGDGEPGCDVGAVEVQACGGPDTDADGSMDACDNCPSITNEAQIDGDADGIGDACDTCIDADLDGACDDVDVCVDRADPSQADGDGDLVGDACDDCPALSNPTQQDFDDDGFGDGCDVCPRQVDPHQIDDDGDGIGDVCDNCRTTPNPDQLNRDADPLGDACDPCTDRDGDGYGLIPGLDCPHPELDCEDAFPWINPGAVDIPSSGIDEDCNPSTPGGCTPQLAEASASGTPGRGGVPSDFVALVLTLSLCIAARHRTWAGDGTPPRARR